MSKTRARTKKRVARTNLLIRPRFRGDERMKMLDRRDRPPVYVANAFDARRGHGGVAAVAHDLQRAQGASLLT